MKEHYPLALEVLGLPEDTSVKTMLNTVGERLCHAKLAGMGPTDEACYVLGVHRGATSLAHLEKRLMDLDTVMVLSMAGDSSYRCGCEEIAAPAPFLLLSPCRSIGKPSYYSSSPLLSTAFWIGQGRLPDPKTNFEEKSSVTRLLTTLKA